MRKQPAPGPSSSSFSSSMPNNSASGNSRQNIFFPVNLGQNMNSLNSSPTSLPNGNGNGNGNGNASGPSSTTGGGSVDEPLATYTLQGVMQWLNRENRRFESDRNSWEIERAYLVAQVSHLMGLKVGYQKTQDDLLRKNRIFERRIKALEYALRAERAKNAGKEVPLENGELSESPTPSQPLDILDTDVTPLISHPERQQSRKMLESCLREVNYLLNSPSIPIRESSPATYLTDQREAKPPEPEYEPQRQSEPITYVPVESESSRQSEEEELPRKLPRKVNLLVDDTTPITTKEDSSWDFTPPPFDSETSPSTILERSSHPRFSAKSAFEKKSAGDPRVFHHIHTLRSHLGPVRALIACNSAATLPEETCFISAGDDSTVKFWRVNRTGHTSKKRSNFDVLPQITFRGHTGMITCLAESLGNIWSAGSDCGIRGWKVPAANRDAYGSSVDASSMLMLEGHTNCIWSLAVPGTQQPLLASASADGTVKIWDTRLQSRSPLRASVKYPEEAGRVTPTCVSWDWEGRGIIIGWENAVIEMWDIERGAAVSKLVANETSDTGGSAQVNCFVKHPFDNLIVAGYEDRQIRVFDTRSGECVNSWTAHLDSISSLAISPDGSTLLSGSQDSSVRFWDLSDKTCLQEALPPHRQRGDEGVLSVSWGMDEVAGSAGADGIVKLYVEQ